MKKILLLLPLLVIMSIYAQNPTIIPVTVAPSGSCTNGLPNQQVIGTGIMYTCQGGTWTAATGGGGTISGQVNGTIPLATGPTTIGGQSPFTVSNSNVSLSPGDALYTTAGTNPLPSSQITSFSWTAYHAFGTSITCGVGAGGTSSCSTSGYANGIAAATGATLTNYGVAGAFVCGTYQGNVFNNENPGSSETTLRTVEYGANDATVAGQNQVGYFDLCMQADIAWMATESGNKYTGASFGSLPTNWSLDTTYSAVSGLQSTTNAAVSNWSVTVPTFSPSVPATPAIFIWYRTIAGDLGTASVKIDGTLAGNINFASQGSQVQLLIVPTTSGSHTVAITVTSSTSASNVVSILAVGTATATLPAGTPLVWAMGLGRRLSDQGTFWSATQFYDQHIRKDVALLASYGLGVYFVDVRNYWTGLPATIYSGDSFGVHPTGPYGTAGTGSAQILQAFLAPTGNPTYNPALDLTDSGVTQVTGSQTSYALTCADQVVQFYDSSNVTVTLPATGTCDAGKWWFVQDGGQQVTFTGVSQLTTPLFNGNSAFIYSLASASGFVIGYDSSGVLPPYVNIPTTGCRSLSFPATITITDACMVAVLTHGTLSAPSSPIAGEHHCILNLNGGGAITMSGFTGFIPPLQQNEGMCIRYSAQSGYWFVDGESVGNQTFITSLTTTAATTDNVTVTGMTSSGRCTLTATNASAAADIVNTYISAKTTNQITVMHSATANETFDIICHPPL